MKYECMSGKLVVFESKISYKNHIKKGIQGKFCNIVVSKSDTTYING